MDVKMTPLEALSPHPLNDEIYRDEADAELVAHIGRVGIVQPLLVTQAGVVISGHRRLDAARKLQMGQVPVLVAAVTDPLAVEEMLIEANRHRRQSNEQLVREYQHLKTIEARRVEAAAMPAPPPAPEPELEPELDLSGAPPRPPTPPPEPAPAVVDPTLLASDEVMSRAARRLGRAPRTLERGLSVVEHIDQLHDADKFDEATELRHVLNTRSVAAAWRKVSGEAPKPRPEQPPVARMKRMAGDLERWLDAHHGSPHAETVRVACVALASAVEVIERAVEE